MVTAKRPYKKRAKKLKPQQVIDQFRAEISEILSPFIGKEINQELEQQIDILLGDFFTAKGILVHTPTIVAEILKLNSIDVDTATIGEGNVRVTRVGPPRELVRLSITETDVVGLHADGKQDKKLQYQYVLHYKDKALQTSFYADGQPTLSGLLERAFIASQIKEAEMQENQPE